MTDDQIEAYRAYIAREIRNSYSQLCMAYDCECGARTYYVMDRFPMSYKIGFECESCKKFDFRKIVEPFVYYSKLCGEIDSPEDLIFVDKTDPQCILLKLHMDFENKRQRDNAAR